MEVLLRLHESFDSEVIFQPQESSAVSRAFLEIKTAEFKSCVTLFRTTKAISQRNMLGINFATLCHLSRCGYRGWPLIGNLSNHDDDGNKSLTNLHI